MRNHDLDLHKLVAPCLAAQRRGAFAPQPQPLAALGAWSNPDSAWAIDGRDFHFRPQGRLGYGDGHLGVDVVALALEKRMGFHFGDNVKVSWRPAVQARVALTRHS